MKVTTVLKPEFAKLFPSHTCSAYGQASSRLYGSCDNTDNATKIEGQKCGQLFALAAQMLKNASLISHIKVTCDQSTCAPVSEVVFRNYC
ncbi:hypothetical protein AAVH_16662 [Aphelenchoides avenae]|nr:hypothetical protein AAVH_21316 [Aphelenchus avenae]KAH7715930.1 hypothetical protein AAVH_16662 [Aphelenchus avenae]